MKKGLFVERMSFEPDFEINASAPVSRAFKKLNLHTFHQAANHVSSLPYQRNLNKEDLLTLLDDHCGTCSTKHALLKQLADEHQFEGLNLVLSIFKMNAGNTPKVARTLTAYDLEYVPEAHTYLKYMDKIIDYTGSGFDPANYEHDVLVEKVIAPNQITDFKVAYHRSFLSQWLQENETIAYSLDKIWEIREQCILDLGA
jgi:hypothetical protein